MVSQDTWLLLLLGVLDQNGFRTVLHDLHGAGVPRINVHPLQHLLDAVLAWRLCLGWQCTHVQLAPSAHDLWHGGALWSWWVICSQCEGLIEPRPEQGSTNSLQGSYFGVLILGLSWQGELGCSNGTSYHYWEEVESVGTASQIFRDRVSETFCKRPDHNFFRLCNGMIVICVAIT